MEGILEEYIWYYGFGRKSNICVHACCIFCS